MQKKSSRAQEYIRQKIKSGVYTGAALIFGRPGEKMIELYEGHLGATKALATLPVNAATLFDLQSITKSVATAAVAMRLVETGRLDLFAAIGPALQKLTPHRHLDAITFLQLLTHSSGLSDLDLEVEMTTVPALWEHMFAAKPHFAPGTSIEYTDLGYRILGRTLEVVGGQDLPTMTEELVWRPMGLKRMAYPPFAPDNVAATPDAHGVIDDEQVQFLGGRIGCDGVFSNADSLFTFMADMLSPTGVIGRHRQTVEANQRKSTNLAKNYFEALLFGGKNLGWETNQSEFSYAGPFHSLATSEKAGGAGTFIWFDSQSQFICVYLTNHGKPKPFDEQSWSNLVEQVGSRELANLIYETI